MCETELNVCQEKELILPLLTSFWKYYLSVYYTVLLASGFSESLTQKTYAEKQGQRKSGALICILVLGEWIPVLKPDGQYNSHSTIIVNHRSTVTASMLHIRKGSFKVTQSLVKNYF